MDITETNAITGQTTQRNYTAQEKADIDAMRSEAKTTLDAEIAANEAKAADKTALLAKLGITADEAKLLLS